jgi:hypothetical protein
MPSKGRLKQYFRAFPICLQSCSYCEEITGGPEMGPMTYRITAFAAGAEFLLLFWFARRFAVDLTGQRSLPLVIHL